MRAGAILKIHSSWSRGITTNKQIIVQKIGQRFKKKIMLYSFTWTESKIVNIIIRKKKFFFSSLEYLILTQDSNLDLDIRSILLCHWASKNIKLRDAEELNLLFSICNQNVKPFTHVPFFLRFYTAKQELKNINKRV